MENIITKIKWSFSVILIIQTFCNMTCNKSVICNPDPIYAFQIGIEAYPDRDSVKVGDTLFLSVKAPTNMTDLISNSTIAFNGAKNFGTAIAFGKMLGAGSEVDAVSYLNFYLIEGHEISSVDCKRFKEYVFIEKQGFYEFKLAIIPKESGVFRLGVTNASNVYTKDYPCDKADIAINFQNTDQHLYFNEWNFGVKPDTPNGAYCFKVTN